jgi:hypothetical protein
MAMTRSIAALTTFFAAFAAMSVSVAHAQQGRIACTITENGGAASGTAIVRQNGRDVSTGSCGTPLSVAAGTYDVTLRLDGALDRPEQTKRVTVRAGQTASATADFATAILEVRITAGGRRAAGMAIITRNGVRIGTLGSGVSGHLSAGTYDVVVRYRTQERRFDAVSLTKGQRRALSAAF